MGICIEIIGPQKDSVRRGLANILPKLNKHLCGLELRFIPVLSWKTDNNLACRVRNAAVKHDQITSNIKIYEIEGITNINRIIPYAPNLTLRKLIMGIKTEDGDSYIITINSNSQGTLKLCVKKKCKKFASFVAYHLPAWLCKQHQSIGLPLFLSEILKIVKETAWEDNTPFQYVNKDAQAILDTDADWLIDCDDISLSSNAFSFIAVDNDESINSFLSTTSNKVTFSQTNKVCIFDSAQTGNTPPTAIDISDNIISPPEHSTPTSDSESAKGSVNPLASG